MYRVLSAKHKATRFEAAHASLPHPIHRAVNRAEPALDRWQKAKEGDGQVILLSGTPGVGKSRLIYELKSNIRHEPHFLLSYQCSPYHSQSAFFPVIEQIEQAPEVGANDSDANKFAKLKAYLPARQMGSMIRSLIANLLSISTEDRNALSKLSPQQIKNRTISSFRDALNFFCAATDAVHLRGCALDRSLDA